jgi:hypothetical protein
MSQPEISEDNLVPEEAEIETGELLSAEDEKLLDLFDKMEHGSLETLEKAAQQVITLATSLLGLYFGVLSFADQAAYLNSTYVIAAASLSLVGMVAALTFGLNVVRPRHYRYDAGDLDAMRALLSGMHVQKRASLALAYYFFAVGLFFLGVAVFLILLGV